MQQPYDKPSYGTSLTTTVTSGYGTINPGPTSVPTFMGGPGNGEMLGNAADISNTAQYTPTTHVTLVEAIKQRVGQEKNAPMCTDGKLKQGICMEGKLFAFQGVNADQPFGKMGRRRQRAHGARARIFDRFDDLNAKDQRSCMIRPLAADAFHTSMPDDHVVALSVAYTGVCKVLCNHDDTSQILAGDRVFARLGKNGIEVSTLTKDSEDRLLDYYHKSAPDTNYTLWQCLGHAVLTKTPSDNCVYVCLA